MYVRRAQISEDLGCAYKYMLHIYIYIRVIVYAVCAYLKILGVQTCLQTKNILS